MAIHRLDAVNLEELIATRLVLAKGQVNVARSEVINALMEMIDNHLYNCLLDMGVKYYTDHKMPLPEEIKAEQPKENDEPEMGLPA